MGTEYRPGMLANDEIAARDESIQDPGPVRTLRLHQIERHPTQLLNGEGTDYRVEAVPAGDADEER